MQGSFILSLALDVLAIVIMLIPPQKYRRLSTDLKRVTYGKRACSVALLLAGFLIDKYITHR